MTGIDTVRQNKASGSQGLTALCQRDVSQMATGSDLARTFTKQKKVSDRRVDQSVDQQMVLAPSRALKSAREERGLSLRALSERVGLAYSTLSKLENGKMAITYDKLIRLSQGLGVDIHDLIAAPNQSPTSAAIGRRSVTRAGSEAEAVSEDHSHLFPAADLLGRKMVPVIINVRARSLDEAGGLFRHSGEEFLYVLNGSMELHSDLYAPLELGPGDSIYFDSGMAHAYVWTSKERCTILTVNTGPGIQRLADTAGTTWMVPRDEISRSD